MFSPKRVKIMVLAAVAAMALTAVGATSASASILSAKFSGSTAGYLRTTGVTIKKNGGSAKSCTASTIRIEEVGPGAFIGTNESFGGIRFYCSGSWGLQMAFWGYLEYDSLTGRYWLQVLDKTEQQLESPFGYYYQNTGETDQWTWVNGTSTTSPSTIALNEQYVGKLVSTNEKITISGTFTATTLSGGLLKLTH